MTRDATFEEGGERPLRLMATDAADLQVISSLMQDAVVPGAEMTWDRRARRFAMLVNRFRWEDAEAAERAGREVERVRSLLVVEDALAVSTQGVDRTDADMVYAVLSLAWQPGEDGTGRIEIVLSGDGAIGIEAEALSVVLKDVSRPYRAVSGRRPDHP